MKKVALLLAIVIILATPLSVQAANQRIIGIMPELTFNGTTANCSVRVIGNNTSEHIEVAMKLWRGPLIIDMWTADGYGYVFLGDTSTVSKNQTYTLTADVKIDGVSQPRVSCSDTCE